MIDLWTHTATRKPTPARKLATIGERFAAFHAAHPEVYAEMRRLALDAVRAGRKRLGAKALAERVRWEFGVAKGDEEFAINNSYVALYARLLEEQEPALVGVFETRARKAA